VTSTFARSVSIRVAINGIGVAGPTLAYWLRRYGMEPVLFEKAPALRTGGYLIDFWGLGYAIAERMGLIPTLRQRCYEMEWLRMVDGDGRSEAALHLAPLRAALAGRFMSVARSDLSAALLGACQGIPTHFGVHVTGLEQEGDSVLAIFSDGRRDHFDLVIGADGLHSAVRRLVFGPEARFEQFLDCYVAAFRIPNYPFRDELTYVSHTVSQRQAGRVSLRNDATLALLVCGAKLIGGEPPPEGRKAALRRAFGDMGWEVPALLDAMDQVDDVYFDRVSQIHLRDWSSGRVGLVGDAAACPSLLAGEGTGLGMTEAYILAGELHRAGGDVARAFAAYQERLYSFVTAKQKAALGFRGFFAPRTSLGLLGRRLAVNALSLPFLGKRLVVRSVRDDLELPEYSAA
jgi:2-polyprenyl-6-methoxyphenol hydroxylase-like FAD-dependent oxidoreductase